MGAFKFNLLLCGLSVSLLIGIFSDVGAQSVPAKIYLELFYINPWNNAKDGWCDIMPHDRKCDVFFKICIWNGYTFSSSKCDVAEINTHTFDESQTVHLKGDTHLQILLKEKPPPVIRLRVEAWDKDIISPHDHIATFVSEAISLDSGLPFRPIDLVKTDQTPSNQDVKVSVSLKLECSMHYYGRLCETYCQSDFKSYLCDSQGNYVCYPGFKGPLCNEKDYCYFEPCPPQSVCANNAAGDGRTCYCNGGSGPECYEVRDVCNPSPCKNGGICQKTGLHGQQFLCQCKGHWYGPVCTEQYSSCQAALNILKLKASTEEGWNNSENITVCANGGTCVDHPNEFSHRCECLPGWKGETCEIPDWTRTICLAIFLPLLLACFVLLAVLCIRRRKTGRCIRLPKFSTTKMSFLRPNMSENVRGIQINQNVPPTVEKPEALNAHETQGKLFLRSPANFESTDDVTGESNDMYATIGADLPEPSLPTPIPPNSIPPSDIYAEPLLTRDAM